MKYWGLALFFLAMGNASICHAQSTIDGHIAVTVQKDSLDNQSSAIAMTVPFTERWALEGMYSQSNGEFDSSGQTVESYDATQQQLGLLFDAGSWSVAMSAMQYEDGAFLRTEQFKLQLGNQVKDFGIRLEALGREHNVALILPNREFRESFHSAGFGLDLNYAWSSGIRAYAGGQYFDYETSEILNSQFRALLALALQYPELAERMMSAYRQLITQQQRAQGGLTQRNVWAGVEWQWGSELFAFDHYVSVAEIDGNEFTTDALLWSHSFSADLLLDVSLGQSSGAGVDNSQFASLSVHWFW